MVGAPDVVIAAIWTAKKGARAADIAAEANRLWADEK
jgi:hypothetical protein